MIDISSYNRDDILFFEKAVNDLLLRALSEHETLEHYFGPAKFDFCLPKGLKAMEWPANTHVEVKYNLIYNSLDRILMQKSRIKPAKLIVIVKDNKGILQYLIDLNEKKDLDVLTLDELKQKLGDIAQQKSIDEKKEIKDDILARAKERIKNSTVTIFLGAGVSASAGVVTWESLLEQLCVKKHLSKIDSDIDSTIKGRFIVDKYKQNGEITPDFYEDMKKILYRKGIEPSELIISIANIANKENIESVVTYNYDDLLEECMKSFKLRNSMSVYEYSRLEKKRDLPVYHVHGLIPKNGTCSSIVLGEREYHKIYQEAYNWGNVEQLHALTRNTCFFIGLSMKDPNLRRLLDISVQQGSERERVHFAFLRRIEYDVDFTEANMREFGVNCIWYDNHADLPKLLDDLIK